MHTCQVCVAVIFRERESHNMKTCQKSSVFWPDTIEIYFDNDCEFCRMQENSIGDTNCGMKFKFLHTHKIPTERIQFTMRASSFGEEKNVHISCRASPLVHQINISQINLLSELWKNIENYYELSQRAVFGVCTIWIWIWDFFFSLSGFHISKSESSIIHWLLCVFHPLFAALLLCNLLGRYSKEEARKKLKNSLIAIYMLANAQCFHAAWSEIMNNTRAEWKWLNFNMRTHNFNKFQQQDIEIERELKKLVFYSQAMGTFRLTRCCSWKV